MELNSIIKKKFRSLIDFRKNVYFRELVKLIFLMTLSICLKGLSHELYWAFYDIYMDRNWLDEAALLVFNFLDVPPNLQSHLHISFC